MILASVTLAQVGGVLTVAALVGTAAALFLSRGIREALAIANENVKTLLSDRDIDRDRHKRALADRDEVIAERDKTIAELRVQNDVLKTSLVDDLTAEVQRRRPRSARS